jgi:hypothetical protein
LVWDILMYQAWQEAQQSGADIAGPHMEKVTA